MTGDGAGKRMRGSVLMEFVIVAPLYFALLGGLFFIGELTLNRLRMHIGDHTGTWLGATRLMGYPTDSKGNPLKGDLIAKLLQEKLFLETMELTGRIKVNQIKEDGSDSTKINRFMAMYAGGIEKLSVSLPDWARGMLFMQDAMTGEDTSDFTTKQSYTYFSDAENDWRDFSFHRYTHLYDGDSPRNPGIGKSNDRAGAAVNLVKGEVLGNVIGDGWICMPESSTGDSPQVPQGQNDKEGIVTRELSQWGE